MTTPLRSAWRRWSSRWHAPLAGLGLAAALTGGSAHAFELRRDATGELVRWTAPITFTVDQRLEATLGDAKSFGALDAAARELDGRSGIPPLVLRAGVTGRTGFDPAPGAVNGSEIVVVTDWPADRDAVASTIVTLDRRSHRILDADILLNASENDLGVVTGPDGALLYDLQGAATHELGHALGLMHTDVEGAVMFPKSFKGDVSKRELQQDDLAGLEALYGARDAELTTPVGCTQAPGEALVAFGLLPLLLAARRRRAAVALTACLLAMTALAAEPAAAPAPPQTRAFTGKVIAVSTAWVEGQPGVLVTHVTLQVSACTDTTADCERFVVVPVPGGVSGDLEQVVDGRRAPQLGDELGVVLRPGSARGELFDLASVPERTRFFARVAVR